MAAEPPLGGPVAVGLDAGGSSIKAGLVAPGGRLLHGPAVVAVRPESGRDGVLEAFAAALAGALAAAGGRDLRGIGVGMPGPFDYERGVSLIRGLGKYEAIYGLDLGAALRDRLDLGLDLPVRFVNDASAFALGELGHGAARGLRRVAALTLGTGCGSAFAVDGRLVADGEGVPPGGFVYGLPYRGGIVDDHLSTRGVLALWRELGGAAGGEPSVRELAERARAGDGLACRTFERFGAAIGEALGPVLAAFRPDAVVLGGQIAKAHDLFEAGLAAGPAVRFVPARGIDTSGVLGAAGLVLGTAGRPRAPRPTEVRLP